MNLIGLTKEEVEEFNQLKRDLLEYHTLNCTHYNPKKERYNELRSKLVAGWRAKQDKIQQIFEEKRLARWN